jgi:hypothetical protein
MTNEVVMFATVVFVPRKASIYVASNSNAAGEFRLAIPNNLLSRKIKIRVQCLGYDMKIVTFKKKRLPLPFQTIKLHNNTKLLY